MLLATTKRNDGTARVGHGDVRCVWICMCVCLHVCEMMKGWWRLRSRSTCEDEDRVWETPTDDVDVKGQKV